MNFLTCGIPAVTAAVAAVVAAAVVAHPAGLQAVSPLVCHCLLLAVAVAAAAGGGSRKATGIQIFGRKAS